MKKDSRTNHEEPFVEREKAVDEIDNVLMVDLSHNPDFTHYVLALLLLLQRQNFHGDLNQKTNTTMPIPIARIPRVYAHLVF